MHNPMNKRMHVHMLAEHTQMQRQALNISSAKRVAVPEVNFDQMRLECKGYSFYSF